MRKVDEGVEGPSEECSQEVEEERFDNFKKQPLSNIRGGN